MDESLALPNSVGTLKYFDHATGMGLICNFAREDVVFTLRDLLDQTTVRTLQSGQLVKFRQVYIAGGWAAAEVANLKL